MMRHGLSCMISTLFVSLLGLVGSCQSCRVETADRTADESAAVEKKTPILSATIDFQDYVFYMHKGPENYYPVEEYEAHLKELADCGIKKLYLRVNECGLTHYPTKVAAMYGENDAIHWTYEKQALQMLETFRHYSPLTETIRIGHKYGMEVWAWESLNDDAGVRYGRASVPERYLPAYERLNGWALMDPYYLENPDALAEIEPALRYDEAEVKRINQDALTRFPITKLIFTNSMEEEACKPKMTTENVRIFISDDNMTYVPYNGPFTFLYHKVNGVGQIVLSNLKISSPYIKIGCADNSSAYSMILMEAIGQGELFDTDGKPVPSTWNWCSGDPKTTAVDFSQCIQMAAWDYKDRMAGCFVGILPPPRYYLGVTEFATKKGMQHKVDRFREITQYGFDGFMLKTRCHSARSDSNRYGFNPEVLAAFQARYGHAFSGSEADREGVCQIRAEAIAAYFRACKALTNGRPLFMSAPMPIEMKDQDGFNTSFGMLPWLYKQYFADGSIDGVIMIGSNWQNGKDFSSYFTKAVTGGKPIRVGIFREGAKYTRYPEQYPFEKDMEELFAKNLDEIEFYESMILNNKPAMREFLKRKLAKANQD